jgi:4,5-DOPA dioxygenase extradiol
MLFIGHGSPMNVIEDNHYTKSWRMLGDSLPRPRAIVVISAHWLTDRLRVHIGKVPRTIYDFYGFPPELYQLHYDCPGSPAVAKEIIQQLSPIAVHEDTEWGLDHGAWAPLRSLYPDATIPVLELSVDANSDMRAQYALGKKLHALRDQGILIIGSGNIVHNLRDISWEENAPPFPWATRADETIAELLLSRDHDTLIAYEKLGADVARAIPTPEHFIPLVTLLGATDTHDNMTFPVTGIAHGSISMRSVLFG